MTELGIEKGDLVEVYNGSGSTQAMVYPTAKPKEAFMLFAYPMGVQGNMVNPGTNELVIPNYKQAWGRSARSPTFRGPPNICRSSRRNIRCDRVGRADIRSAVRKDQIGGKIDRH